MADAKPRSPMDISPNTSCPTMLQRLSIFTVSTESTARNHPSTAYLRNCPLQSPQYTRTRPTNLLLQATMAQYYPQQQPYNPQNLQFYQSTYPQPVSGHTTPSQAQYYGQAPQSNAAYGGAPGFGAAPAFGQGVSGRMGEQGGLRTGWLAAFGTEGYDGEPALLEELGVNFGHIKGKVCCTSIILKTRQQTEKYQTARAQRIPPAAAENRRVSSKNTFADYVSTRPSQSSTPSTQSRNT